MQGLVKKEASRGNVSIEEIEKPEPGPTEALIEVAYAGLCGSDAGIYAYEEAYHSMPLPIVFGHEYAGVVVDVGEAVEEVAVGDHVVERPIRACGTCPQCQRGSPNVCDDAEITGVHYDGAYAEYVSTPASSLHVLPEELSLRTAAIAEPSSVATRAVIHNSRVAAGDKVLVEGPGPIGLLTAQIARIQGAEVVVSGVGRDESYRLPLAEDLGFRAVNVTGTDIETVADARTDGSGFDIIFDTTGHPSGVDTAANVVRNGGQVVVIGLAGTAEVDLSALTRSEIDLQCSYASTWEDFERAIRLIRSGSIDVEAFVDDRFSLLDAENAFEAFLDGETCKPVFDVSELHD